MIELQLGDYLREQQAFLCVGPQEHIYLLNTKKLQSFSSLFKSFSKAPLCQKLPLGTPLQGRL